MAATKKIAILICSTRTPRVGPSISSWVSETLKAQVPANIELVIVDLADYPLPISPSGPPIPARVSLPLVEDAYGDAQVDKWSMAVRGVDGFIFLTPQYNWNVPGVLKIATDHLFHEWSQKPMVIISYGGRGGGKAAAALRDIWKSVRGGECVGGVELGLEGEGMLNAQEKGKLSEGVVKVWQEKGKPEEVEKVWGELVNAVSGGEKREPS